MKNLILMSCMFAPIASFAEVEPADYQCKLFRYAKGASVQKTEFTLDRKSGEHTGVSVVLEKVEATVQSTGSEEVQGVAGIIRSNDANNLGASAITYDSVGVLIMSFTLNDNVHYKLRCDRI